MWTTTLRNLLRRLCNFIYLFLSTRWLHAWSRRFPEVSFMTSRDRICITVHVAYITSARHHFAIDKRIYSYKGFVFFGYICKEKREYKTLRVIYPPQLSVCELKVKVHLQGTLKKTYREKNGVSEWIWLFNVTFNDISVIYVTAHRCAGGLKKKLNLRSDFQCHTGRHFVGFFNVPVQAPTRDPPFYGYSDEPPHFSRLLRHAWGYGGHILDLTPWSPRGIGRTKNRCTVCINGTYRSKLSPFIQGHIFTAGPSEEFK